MVSYIILEDRQAVDGEIIHSQADLFRKLQYADWDARVIEFDMDELIRDRGAPMNDVTEDMVHAANAAGVFTDPEHDRHTIAGRYLDIRAPRARRYRVLMGA